MADWPVPQAVGTAPRNSTRRGFWYCEPLCWKTAIHTSSVPPSTAATNWPISSVGLPAGADAGAFCVCDGARSPAPPRKLRMVIGLMPKIQPPISAITMVPKPMLRPPVRRPPPPNMPPPDEERRSSTWSDWRLFPHFMVRSPRVWRHSQTHYAKLQTKSAAGGSASVAIGVAISGLGQRHAHLALVFAAAVLVAGLADVVLVALEEQHLGTAFTGVDLGRQRCGVAELQRHVAFPLGLEGRDVDDDAAAGVGALAQADGQHVARDAEVLHGARQREAVGRDHADILVDVHEAVFVEILRVHHRAVDVGEDLEFGRAADVVAVAAGAVADDLLAGGVLPDLTGLEGLDHAVLLGHAADPFVVFDAHACVLGAVLLRPIVGTRLCRAPHKDPVRQRNAPTVVHVISELPESSDSAA